MVATLILAIVYHVRTWAPVGMTSGRRLRRAIEAYARNWVLHV